MRSNQGLQACQLRPPVSRPALYRLVWPLVPALPACDHWRLGPPPWCHITPLPRAPLPTQSTETPHLPSRVLGHNLGSRGPLLGLRPAIERTQRAQTNQPTPVA